MRRPEAYLTHDIIEYWSQGTHVLYGKGGIHGFAFPTVFLFCNTWSVCSVFCTLQEYENGTRWIDMRLWPKVNRFSLRSISDDHLRRTQRKHTPRWSLIRHRCLRLWQWYDIALEDRRHIKPCSSIRKLKSDCWTECYWIKYLTPNGPVSLTTFWYLQPSSSTRFPACRSSSWPKFPRGHGSISEEICYEVHYLPLTIDPGFGPGILSKGEATRKYWATRHTSHPRAAARRKIESVNKPIMSTDMIADWKKESDGHRWE